jgi:hypothetical protein
VIEAFFGLHPLTSADKNRKYGTYLVKRSARFASMAYNSFAKTVVVLELED